MRGQVIEMAAELADEAEPTVAAALARFQQITPCTALEAQLWVSVAFLIRRHEQLAADLTS
ncbi:hypothetical protein FHS94_000969 [Sphingomonas aerophila]|uniref:Uncharacterized protein n=2 Tax=Sphingomonas aerophila TaxID=1344948 RepID=A0A7W9BC72_9SPHN|nr:hypothetical protein [Sphingomonas aerophila]